MTHEVAEPAGSTDTRIESAKHAGTESAGYTAEVTRRAVDNLATITIPCDLLSAWSEAKLSLM